ncbi:YkvA family protein [Marinoscillum furvescens]|uniref:Uncharacterized membrane protein YkvA (DUF1232 family) n=1 Tax=Marinoscillum furvescens DSM 4134 TaxID=1122208 RepID=A0A3D9KYT8_MARFU|nr:DUF1232 domain-containing protein [Marinoscillum furvescens]RED92638.1 uncharacterized membrane protein YkvA (DUF1232 family) [Marinoscillum furvescens DSM 4134]
MANKKIEGILQRAKDTVSQNEKVQSLLTDVKGRLEKINSDSTERSTFIYQLQVIVRMVRAYISGKYSAFSTSTVVTLVFALIYFITPTDLIPDFIPALGLTDDISLVYFIFRSLAEDIEKFKDWEATN